MISNNIQFTSASLSLHHIYVCIKFFDFVLAFHNINNIKDTNTIAKAKGHDHNFIEIHVFSILATRINSTNTVSKARYAKNTISRILYLVNLCFNSNNF